MLGVWTDLERIARNFLRDRSLQLSPSGQAYLAWLLLRAAVVIVREGKAADPDARGLARNNVELLLATAAGISVTSPAEESELLAGLPSARRRGRITAEDLREALRRLPPLWPLKRRAHAY